MLTVEDDPKDRFAGRLRLDSNIVVKVGASTNKTTLPTDRIFLLLPGNKPSVPMATPTASLL